MGFADKLFYGALIGVSLVTAGGVGVLVLGRRNGSVGNLKFGSAIGRTSEESSGAQPSSASQQPNNGR